MLMECVKPELFAAGPDWLESAEERRHEALWQVARGRAAGEGGVLLQHLRECDACARLVESFRRLDRAASKGAEVFAACPSAQELSGYHCYELPVDRREKIAAHLGDCAYCREDLAWLKCTEEPKVIAMPSRRVALYGAIAAAVALMAGIPLLRNRGRSPYADLARMPAINEKDLLATLERPADFRQTFEDSLSAYKSGDFASAEEKLKPILAADPFNPSALFVEAMAEYRKGDVAQAADLMGRSESTQPMSAFRCWANLQMGLIIGNRARIDRECRHLAGHPEYKDQVRRISETVAQRGA